MRKRVVDQEGYSLMRACTSERESFFSSIRRDEIGHRHPIAGI